MGMRNKSDSNLVSPAIVIDAWPIMGGVMRRVTNQSLNESVPSGWKITTIVPIPKVGRPVRAEDFRPINMLPTMEKLIETVVKNQ